MADVSAAGDCKLRVFISYSRKHEDFAQDLLAGLQVAGFEQSTTSPRARNGRFGWAERRRQCRTRDFPRRRRLRPMCLGGGAHC
jgi:hypothetical protein